MDPVSTYLGVVTERGEVEAFSLLFFSLLLTKSVDVQQQIQRYRRRLRYVCRLQSTRAGQSPQGLVRRAGSDTRRVHHHSCKWDGPTPRGQSGKDSVSDYQTLQGQGLYQTLGLQLPTEPTQDKTPLLIYGGTTATGIYGIQFAKLSGYTVITTGSPKNHELLKSLGADHVFDYRSPTLVQDIRAAAGDDLSYAWDCHADQASANVCARALNQDGAHYAGLLGGIDRAVKAANPKAKVSVSLGYTSFGEDAWLGALYPASQADFDFAKKFWPLAIDLLDEGKVKPIAIDVNRGGSGLEGVLVGLKELAAGKVSAQKLVYTL